MADSLWAVQTPHAFRVEVIQRSLKDILERGQPVRLVESSAPTPKGTGRADLPLNELLLKGL